MATRFAPHAHKVKVREIATGHVTEQWPVDARDLVAFPEFEYVTDAVDEATADTPLAAATPTPPSVRDALDEKSHNALKALGKKAGIIGTQSKAELIDALLPHIAAGTVAVEPVAHFTLPHAQFPNANEG